MAYRQSDVGRSGGLSPSVGILILAGGEATRLPGKLALAAGDVPLVARVYRNFAQLGRETFVAANRTFAPELDALLPVPIAIDRWSKRGPLGGMLTTMACMRSRFVFAVAGDAPFVMPELLDRLLAQLEPSDEAVVPERREDGKQFLEPLAALYERRAFLREGLPVLRGGRGALQLVIRRLRARFVPIESGLTFTNVNTPGDYAALLESLGNTTRERHMGAPRPGEARMSERLSGPDPLSSDNGTGSTPPETGAESSNVVGRPATEKPRTAFHESTETAEVEAEPLTEREAVAEGGSFDGVAPLQDIERP